jgi:hypothetical protein
VPNPRASSGVLLPCHSELFPRMMVVSLPCFVFIPLSGPDPCFPGCTNPAILRARIPPFRALTMTVIQKTMIVSMSVFAGYP